MQRSEVRYAESGDLRIAYQTFGDGPLELVVVSGFISNLDLAWDMPPFAPTLERLGRFAHTLVFDKRGTGLSDRELGFGSLDERMDDIRAVVEAAGFERPSLYGYSEGGPLSLLFAATYPERVGSVVLYGTMARILEAPDYESWVTWEVVEPMLAAFEGTLVKTTDVGGIGVHIGSRIAALAPAGEVWVSRTVKDLTAGSGLQFEERGRHTLKGVPEEWELYALSA